MYQLTHNDLDGYGCRLVLDYYYDVNEVVHTDYNKIAYYLKSLNNRVKDKKILFITDLNFKVKDDFQALLEVLKNGWVVFYFDHHEYPENNIKFFDYLQNNFKFFYFIDQSKCATGLLYDYLASKKGHNENLKQLTEIICTYDIWKTDSKLWPVAFMLNDIFYDIGEKEFFYQIKENDYKLKKEWFDAYKEKLKAKEKYYKALEDEGLMFVQDGVRIFILPDFQFSSHMNLDFNEKHKIFLYPEIGKISVRHNWNVDTEKDKAEEFLRFLEKFSEIEFVSSAGGHLNAQGITFKSPRSLNEYEVLIQQMLNKINTLEKE